MKTFIFASTVASTLLAVSAQAAPEASTTPLPYLDGDVGCLSQQSADKYISDLNVDVQSFGGLELCDAKSDAKKILTDIYLIESGQFAGSGSNVFNRGFVSRDSYYDYLKRETRGMQRGNDVPYASAYNSGGYFTFQNGWAQSSTLGRVGTIIHEARHTEGFRHVPCTTGPYAGASIDGCDQTLTEGGSHGVEMEYYARVFLEGANFHPVYKSMARLMAIGRGNIFFNDIPLKRREALVLVDQATRQPVLLDGAHLVNRSSPAVLDTYRIKRTSFGASFFDGTKAFGVDLYSTLQAMAPIADAYSYLKMLVRDDTSTLKLKDIEEFDMGTKRYLAGLGEGGQFVTFDFPSGKWSPQIATPNIRAERFVTVAPDGTQGLFVTSGDQLYPYSATTRRVGAALNSHFERDAVTYAKLGAQTLVLAQDGQVSVVKDRGAREAFAPLAGARFAQMVAVPLYDAFEVAGE